MPLEQWLRGRWRAFQRDEEFETALRRFFAVLFIYIPMSCSFVFLALFCTVSWLGRWRGPLLAACLSYAAASVLLLLYYHRTGRTRPLTGFTAVAAVVFPFLLRCVLPDLRAAYFVALTGLIYPLLVDLHPAALWCNRGGIAVAFLAFALVEGLSGVDAFPPPIGPVPTVDRLIIVLICGAIAPVSGVVLLVGLQRVLGHRKARQAAVALLHARQRELAAERRVVRRLLESSLPRAVVDHYLVHLHHHTPLDPNPDSSDDDTGPGSAAEQQGPRPASGGPQLLLATVHHGATVLFADIAGFTQKASLCTAEALVTALGALVAAADQECLALGVEKIRTIGDCYQAAALPSTPGGPTDAREGAEAVLQLAVALHERVALPVRISGEPVRFRVGIHTGSLVAGVLGLTKFCYDLWGETVTLANRMESSGVVGRTHVSRDTHRLLCDAHAFLFSGRHQIKGGSCVEGFLHAPAGATEVSGGTRP